MKTLLLLITVSILSTSALAKESATIRTCVKNSFGTQVEFIEWKMNQKEIAKAKESCNNYRYLKVQTVKATYSKAIFWKCKKSKITCFNH